ncbi:MAG: FtsX-like permease family protein [Chloroflexota bacterium]
MRGLVRYAWRALAARRARTLLTVIGIALGVGVLVAALGVDAGLDASIDRTVASMVGKADLRVAAFEETGLSAATLDQLAAVQGIAVQAPAIERKSFLASQAGRPVESAPVTVLGVDPAVEGKVRDMPLARGAALAGAADATALVTDTLARTDGLAVGDSLQILGAGAPVKVTIAGVLAGDGPALGSGGRTVVLPIRTAMLLGVADGEAAPAVLDRVTRVDLVLAAGAPPDQVAAAIGTALTLQPYVLSKPQDIAASLRASTLDVRSTMALLAAITLFAAAILILNTMAMTVVERIRELGLLRAAGASRGQIGRVVATQALVLGVAGSVLGIAIGIGLAFLAAAWLRASGQLTIDGPVITPWAVAGGLLAGVGITLVAAFEPARRAASVSPVAALRVRADPAQLVRSHTRWLVVVVVAIGAIAILLLPGGATNPAVPVRAVAIYVLLLVAVLLTPPVLGPLARLVGLPFAAALRLEERLARAAIRRDPSRTALTTGALIVGLAMVVALSAVAATARVSATAWLADVVPGDEILTAIAPAPAGDGGVDQQLSTIDGVQLATPLASFDLAFSGTRLEAVAIVGADFLADGRLTFTSGDRAAALTALDAGGAVVIPAARAQRLGVVVGDTMAVATSRGLVNLKVVGLVDRSFPGRTGDAVLVGWSDATDKFGVVGADAFAVRYAPGRQADAQPQVEALARQLALTASPISAVAGAVGDALDRLFGLLDLLAFAAVVIAALGIVNTLSMNTLERVREIGMLRAAGMSRRQVWRSVLVEAGILGAIGGLVGSIAGVLIGLLLGGGAGADGLIAAIPWGAVALSIVLAVALAMLAAAQPARMAGRVPIVVAVRGE